MSDLPISRLWRLATLRDEQGGGLTRQESEQLAYLLATGDVDGAALFHDVLATGRAGRPDGAAAGGGRVSDETTTTETEADPR